MRNSDPIFWPDEGSDIALKQRINRDYDDCINIIETQWYKGDLCSRFIVGDQDIWGLIYPGVSTYRRKIFSFNISNGMIQMASGRQRQHRKTQTSIPILNGMQKTSDQFTKCLFHINNHEGVYQVHSDCFELGALVKGLGWCYSYLDKTEDPISGSIRKVYVDQTATMYDPYMRKHNMSDCRHWRYRKFYSKEQAALRYPDLADSILGLSHGSYRDEKFYYMPEVYQIQFPNILAIDEYWYATSREATFLIDRETEEVQEWDGDEEQLRDLMRMRDEQGQEFRKKLKVIKRQRPTVRLCILINDRTIVDMADPNSIDRYPVVPCLGYFTPDSPYYAYKYRGMAADLLDPQYLMNRLKVNDLDQVESQQSGIKMELGALVTPTDALNQGNGRVLTTKPGFFDKVDKLHIDPPSPVLLQMEENLKQIMGEISGATDIMMGQEVQDESGVQSALRQIAGQTRLQKLYDQFDEFQRIDGDISISMVQSNWTYGKVRQVIGEEPTPEFDNKLFFKYGCKVVPGVLTESQQQMEAHQLIYCREKLGLPISARRILSKLTLQDKDDLLKEVDQAEQAQQKAAEQRSQLEMQQLQVDNETKLSYAHSQEAQSKERIAKIEVDRAEAYERIKKSKEEEMGSLLDLVRSLKELETIDLTNLQAKIDLLKSMSAESDEDKEEKPKEAVV